MSEVTSDPPRRPGWRFFLRNWFAKRLGVRPERKAEIYISLSQSATLRDTAYWIEILFACGIATLGLVLNSPAVIIGAMLISPLMGPILAGGLALATGDVVLGIRSVTTLAISCVAAITFATFLVAVIPFKEMTPEIAARTHPNTLDLVIALFSGAVGSVAISKKLKGVATSIPGVAIAVALLPPLCVVGYGIGFALSINGAEGMAVARGGGLLFLTNLIAIVFTSMVVFLALNIDISLVREAVREWRDEDPESRILQHLLERIPRSEKLRLAGSLPSRFLLIGSVIAILFIPLSRAFEDLKLEIQRKQVENRVQRAATRMWQENFVRFDNGKIRSYIDTMTARREEERYLINLRVITSEPYTENEKEEYEKLIAASLAVANQEVAVEMVEIPTSAAELRARLEEEKLRSVPAPPPPPPTLAELQTSLAQRVDVALSGLVIPPPAKLIEAGFTVSASSPIVQVAYLAERPISDDAVVLLESDLRRRLSIPGARVDLEWVGSAARIPYGWNSSRLVEEDLEVLGVIADHLARHPELTLQIVAHRDRRERQSATEERIEAILAWLGETIDPARMAARTGDLGEREVELVLRVGA